MTTTPASTPAAAPAATGSKWKTRLLTAFFVTVGFIIWAFSQRWSSEALWNAVPFVSGGVILFFVFGRAIWEAMKNMVKKNTLVGLGVIAVVGYILVYLLQQGSMGVPLPALGDAVFMVLGVLAVAFVVWKGIFSTAANEAITKIKKKDEKKKDDHH